MSNFSLKQRREDYALQVVPEVYRTWSWVSLLSVMLGVTTAMLSFAWGGSLVLAYGTNTLLIGMVIGVVIIGSVGFLLATIASETGLDMDLITSGSGFGYKGAGITSLIYALCFVMYFAMEGNIMASAIHVQYPAIPLWLIDTLISLIFIPLTWYGLTAMNYLMWLTLPLCIIFIGWAIHVALHVETTVSFWSFQPLHTAYTNAGPALLQLVASSLALISCATAAADIGRFIPRKQRKIGTIAISYFLQILGLLGVCVLGAWFAIKFNQTDPGDYFPRLMGVWGMIFVLVSQLRINVLNIYAGSLAFTTFFSRSFGFAPGRHWWIILTAVLPLPLMIGDVLSHITQVMTFASVFIISWVMAVVSYILFNKNVFKITPQNFSFQKGTIPNYNPIGITALLVALMPSVPMAFGLCGEYGKTLAPFVAAFLAFVMVPVMMAITKKTSNVSLIENEIETVY